MLITYLSCGDVQEAKHPKSRAAEFDINSLGKTSLLSGYGGGIIQAWYMCVTEQVHLESIKGDREIGLQTSEHSCRS